ncbi:uncharacterized protein FA14DRAFT_180782 [Meira miltonrushii]|uniref:Uncharacterized protein n=1 Tax=Meira miltonrushii TaxID=1280837 RepID=A0A316VFA6_9BASI|nr:uncharacterized protein FA14DRAFT_180782 [Meira miltonrushii]PWN34155.1 hypothetical protein FA14DRAFT_180782 [Meira miltonrushii]
MLIIRILLVFFLISIICASDVSQSASPTSSSEWKKSQAETSLLAAETVTVEPQTTSRSRAKTLSNTKKAIKSRRYRAQLKGEDLLKYKALRRESNVRAYRARKLLRETNPEEMAKYKEATKERAKKYDWRNKAKTIQDPEEREIYLQKHRAAENFSRRERYARKLKKTGDGKKAVKQRPRAGAASFTNVIKAQSMHEENI